LKERIKEVKILKKKINPIRDGNWLRKSRNEHNPYDSSERERIYNYRIILHSKIWE
jgi:hypothetical protein